jgi:hypothetical protein
LAEILLFHHADNSLPDYDEKAAALLLERVLSFLDRTVTGPSVVLT